MKSLTLGLLIMSVNTKNMIHGNMPHVTKHLMPQVMSMQIHNVFLLFRRRKRMEQKKGSTSKMYSVCVYGVSDVLTHPFHLPCGHFIVRIIYAEFAPISKAREKRAKETQLIIKLDF